MKTINRLSKEYAHANRYSGEGEGKMRRQFENGAGRRVMQRLVAEDDELAVGRIVERETVSAARIAQ